MCNMSRKDQQIDDAVNIRLGAISGGNYGVGQQVMIKDHVYESHIEKLVTDSVRYGYERGINDGTVRATALAKLTSEEIAILGLDFPTIADRVEGIIKEGKAV